MEIQRSKVVDLLNNTKMLLSKIYVFNHNREKDDVFFFIDKVNVELRLLYCDIRDIILSDPFLRKKYIEQLQESVHAEAPSSSSNLD